MTLDTQCSPRMRRHAGSHPSRTLSYLTVACVRAHFGGYVLETLGDDASFFYMILQSYITYCCNRAKERKE